MSLRFKVILVEPENPRNVGFAARAVKCFGFSELAIVYENQSVVPDEAYITGCMCKEVLDDARLYGNLTDALVGTYTAVALSRRPLNLGQQENILPTLPFDICEINDAEEDHVVALVFGRESQGLFREEAVLCPWLCRIPMAEDAKSLNLGQAVSTVMYAFTVQSGLIESRKKNRKNSKALKLAPLDQQKALVDFIQSGLKGKPDFYQTRLDHLEQFIYGLNLNQSDFSMLFKVFKELADPKSGRIGRKDLAENI